ncbi:hypothetical protein TGAM01_v200134 [Trichoderma gamsii]|uniref:Uncharacterized protein n=1 Tax=Trichoderma gamsii TaxID=398673 RepID=A0A2P5A2G8_9HYPO|nr:hypothetical protein TGAM01_v200134 [Trichoderma gamsii]PON30714.1 hypothetical protein TGAM01_v200134 [Trichoderma gamsii]
MARAIGNRSLALVNLGKLKFSLPSAVVSASSCAESWHGFPARKITYL